ncbi:MAG: hypothetical protein LUE22_07590 [Oscillospiraceae bacterium]|nr:hypothetical protein [Oscillospiraceae bacterium]
MNKMSFFKGIGVGLMVGSMVGMAAAPRKKKLNIGKALKSMGDVVDSVAGSMGL